MRSLNMDLSIDGASTTAAKPLHEFASSDTKSMPLSIWAMVNTHG